MKETKIIELIEDVITELNHLIGGVITKADVKRLATELRKIYERA